MSPWQGEAARLAERVDAFVEGSLQGGSTEPFEALALDLHRFQRAHDPVVAALAEAPPTTWRAIPAVPVSLFKELRVGTVPPGEEAVVFRTSGTTGSGRGQHFLRSTALYDKGALGWARACLPVFPARVVALLEDPARVPDASLAHMVSLFAAPGRASWHLRDGELDRAGLHARIEAATEPLFVAATAFALVAWLQGDAPALPPGSVLMVTGGFKGRVQAVDDEALFDGARAVLRPAHLVTEYGMTELSSQLWGLPGEPYRPPPWMRVLAVDPIRGAPLPAGERGVLRFVDLCNLDATVAIETQDEGTVLADGGVRLHGRLAGAPARGCSLPVEESWLREDR